ncbi:MAG TPA: alpha/beta hydrolase [Vicinamibacterales bacterium]|nr:alpha/beta hydrolase [Vicinamibacterales bacterium]
MRRLAAAVALTVLCASSLAAQAPKSLFFTAADGTKIHYFEIAGKGTPVILIHGYTANAEGKWIKPSIAQTLARNHRVIAIDARGHGKSDKPHDPAKYGPRMATDVIELMDHLKIAKAHIHGYSMGGSILTQVLARHQDRVISAIYGGSGPQETDPKIVATVPKDPEPPAATDPNAPRGENWSSYAGYDRAALDAVQQYPWKPGDREIDLTTVKVPVAAIVGSLDRPNARTHRLKRELKGVEITIIPGETHGSVHLNPVYTATLVKFIDAHDK